MLATGIKRYAVSDQTGWCYLSYVDVGFAGDPRLTQWETCPLGKTLRVTLFILFAACAEFARQFDQSGATLVADSYYMSPLLLLCLAFHKVFGYGTVRRRKNGISGAMKLWEMDGVSLVNRGDTRFARTTLAGKELAVVEFRDARDVLFVSSAHIFQDDFKPVPYRCVGGKGPEMRFI